MECADRIVEGAMRSGTKEPTALAFDPTGKVLASLSGNELDLWDVQRRALISGAPFAYLESSGQRVACFASGRRLLVVGGNGAVVYDVDPQSWLTRACRLIEWRPTQAEWTQAGGVGAVGRPCRQ